MLSYQHAYHAGNAADVFKHTLWANLLVFLTQAKPTPLYVYETHAGRGIYPTHQPEMQKLKEYATGLARLPWNKPEASPYLQAVHALNDAGKLEYIPGSPAVAAHNLRPTDHLTLAEAHPQEFEHLRTTLHRPNLHLHLADGHTHIAKLLRQGQRNVVLIDPSYEVKTEYTKTVETVAALLKAAPQTTVMVWYPLLPTHAHAPLVKGLKELAISATRQYEYIWAEPQPKGGMYGTGNIILNTPYGADALLEDSLKPLAKPLANPKGVLAVRSLVARK